jgi:hypothetical protein
MLSNIYNTIDQVYTQESWSWAASFPSNIEPTHYPLAYVCIWESFDCLWTHYVHIVHHCSRYTPRRICVPL